MTVTDELYSIVIALSSVAVCSVTTLNIMLGCYFYVP